jgi:hypothetical protein
LQLTEKREVTLHGPEAAMLRVVKRGEAALSDFKGAEMIVGVEHFRTALVKPTGVMVLLVRGRWSLRFFLKDEPLYTLAFDSEWHARFTASNLVAKSGFKLLSTPDQTHWTADDRATGGGNA